jgi:hypothetical protein
MMSYSQEIGVSMLLSGIFKSKMFQELLGNASRISQGLLKRSYEGGLTRDNSGLRGLCWPCPNTIEPGRNVKFG